MRILLLSMVSMMLSATSAGALELETAPNGASVFQKVRGKYHFVGYTPMVLEEGKLQDKSYVELLLLKYGHHDVTRKLDLVNDASPTTIALTRLDRATKAPEKSCEKEIAAGLEAHLGSRPHPLKFGQFAISSDTEGRRFLYLGMQVIQYDQLYAIRRAKRLDARGVNGLVEEMVKPVVEPILGLVSKAGCLAYLQVDVGYRASKRFKLSLETTPTVDRYYHSWTERVGNTVYRKDVTFTQRGQKTSYKSKLVHDAGNAMWSLRYDLQSK